MDGYVRFRFSKERLTGYNRQLKPKAYVFGNLVATRPKALLEGKGFFADPSVVVQVPRPYEFDLDGLADINLAECLINSGAARLPHMEVVPSNEPMKVER